MRRISCAVLISILSVSIWRLAVAENPAPPHAVREPNAMRELITANPELVPFLLEQLGRPNHSIPNQTEELMRAIAVLGDAATPQLIDAMAHKDPKFRGTAMNALLYAAASPRFSIRPVVPALLRLARTEEDNEFREIAVVLLARVIRMAGDDAYRARMFRELSKDEW
jgi:hypothetical protein